MRTTRTRLTRTAVCATVLCAVVAAQAAAGADTTQTLPARPFAVSTATQTNPDDITKLGGAIFVSFQNGVGPEGQPGPLGANSTVAEYGPDGFQIDSFSITGRVDGLTADASRHRIIATANEDLNSSLWVIRPGAPPADRLVQYTYDPSPAETIGTQPAAGGTDSISIKNGRIFLAHSNPATPSSAAVYEAHLDATTHIAHLDPVFADNATAIDAVTGKPVTLALTDPDSNRVFSHLAPRFGGELAQVSQADGEIIFLKSPGGVLSTLTRLSLLNPTGTTPPPVDDVVVATADRGTLYVTDNGAGTVTALLTDGLPAGTIFAAEASDTGTPFVATLNLKTGRLTPFGNTFTNPKGLLFVPAPHDRS